MHHELPERLDLRWYRKSAKDLLRAPGRRAGGARPRPRGPRRSRPVSAQRRAGDVDGLRALLDANPELVRARYSGAASTILEAVAQPDVFGDRLGVELGVDRRIVELLIECGSELDVPLNLAACFVAAGAGRLDRLETWFDAEGVLRPEALELRPNLADVGWPPAPPPHDDPQEALDEAFALAAYSGRIAAMELLLKHGASVDGAAHLGLTGLHFAVIANRVDVARWLVEHGADPDVRDRIHDSPALGWAEHNATGSAVHRYLAGLAA
jgi:hypothetical protein